MSQKSCGPVQLICFSKLRWNWALFPACQTQIYFKTARSILPAHKHTQTASVLGRPELSALTHLHNQRGVWIANSVYMERFTGIGATRPMAIQSCLFSQTFPQDMTWVSRQRHSAHPYSCISVTTEKHQDASHSSSSGYTPDSTRLPRSRSPVSGITEEALPALHRE